MKRNYTSKLSKIGAATPFASVLIQGPVEGATVTWNKSSDNVLWRNAMQRNESTTPAVRTAGARNTTRLVAAALAIVAGISGTAGTAHAAPAALTFDNSAGTFLYSAPTNWNSVTPVEDNRIPATGDTVTIGGSTNYAVLLTVSTPSLASLTIASGSSLTNQTSSAHNFDTITAFTNAGTLGVNTVTAGTGTMFLPNSNITNTGGKIIASSGGTIGFVRPNIIITNGELTINTPAKLDATSDIQGNLRFSNVTSVINGTMNVSPQAPGGNNTNRSNRNKTLTVTSGSFTLGGTLTASTNTTAFTNTHRNLEINATVGTNFAIVSGGTLLLQNTNNFNSNNGNPDNNGRAVFALDATSTFSNAGTLNLQNDSGVNTTGGTNPFQTVLFSRASGSTFSNTGTINLTDASTYLGTHSTKLTSGSNLTNAGTISANGSTANSLASIEVTGSYTQSAGSTILNNRSQLITTTGATFNGGTLAGSGLGAAMVSGALTVIGANVAPGSTGVGTVGTLGVTGATTFGNGSILNIDLINDTKDLLAITGNINLSSLSDNVTFATSGTQTQSRYVFATFTGTRTGTFDTFTAPSGFLLDYSVANEIAVLIPEPTSLAALGLFGLAALRRRRIA